MFSLIPLEAVGRGLVTISLNKDKNYFLGKNIRINNESSNTMLLKYIPRLPRKAILRYPPPFRGTSDR